MSFLIRKLKLYLVFFRFFLVHRRNRASIEAWQERELRRLMDKIRRKVPYYRELYAHRGASSDMSLRSLRDLPVTSKTDLLNQPVERYSNTGHSLRGIWRTTSGTSGKPFTILRDRKRFTPLYGSAIAYRFLFWEKPWRFNIHRIRIARIKVRSHPAPNRLSLSVRELLSDTDRAMRMLIEFGPDVLESYASLLYMLAQRVLEKGVTLKCAYAIAFGEKLTPHMRRTIERAFACEVYDRYGIEETGVIGMECRMHDGFHVNAESVIIEVVDGNGRPVPEGEHGRVIVTDLINSRMPFVRYDTGDNGRLSWERCACGIGAPRLWVEGRYAAFLTVGGRVIHHLEFDAALDTFMHVIAQYQVVKRSDTALEIRIIPGGSFNDRARDEIARSVQAVVGSDISVSVVPVTQLSRAPHGKCEIVVDESAR